ncbi:RHS repeat domain-containing protein [Pantoea ananatis]
MRRSQWDRYGRLTSETDPAGRTTEYYWFETLTASPARCSRIQQPLSLCMT